ncbi:MAG: formyltransferase [Usitatibacteraceae bacterium]
MSSAVVFAYHNVGVQCLRVLLRHGVEIPLVVTHIDNPNENIWFESVAKLADAHHIPVATPDDPNTPTFIERVASLKPDFLFSFYYRMMLKPALLATATHGAFNMHGSLLPKYRGRVPVNWAIIKGETETGATMHEMVEKPDAGRIVGQEAVPILPDDTALKVFEKVTFAAEVLLDRALPALLAGSAVLRTQDLSKGSYYGGRKPEDGIINWNDSALNIHNLVRAVAPPYPGATTTLKGKPITITRTSLAPAHFTHNKPGFLNVSSARCIALCGDGRMLRVLEAQFDGKMQDEAALCQLLGVGVYPLGIY